MSRVHVTALLIFDQIEVILSAGQAPVAVPVKALGDRIV